MNREPVEWAALPAGEGRVGSGRMQTHEVCSEATSRDQELTQSQITLGLAAGFGSQGKQGAQQASRPRPAWAFDFLFRQEVL